MTGSRTAHFAREITVAFAVSGTKWDGPRASASRPATDGVAPGVDTDTPGGSTNPVSGGQLPYSGCCHAATLYSEDPFLLLVGCPRGPASEDVGK